LFLCRWRCHRRHKKEEKKKTCPIHRFSCFHQRRRVDLLLSFTLHTDLSIWSWASLLMVEASGSCRCGEDLLETMVVEEKLLPLALFLWRDWCCSRLGQAMVVVLLLADGCWRRRWGQFMEAKRGAGSPVKTTLLRLVAKESAVDGGWTDLSVLFFW